MKASLEPAEYEVVQGVFKRLAQATWFDRTAVNEKACAKLVLKFYSAGATNPEDLFAACEPEARRSFGSPDAPPTSWDPLNADPIPESR